MRARDRLWNIVRAKLRQATSGTGFFDRASPVDEDRPDEPRASPTGAVQDAELATCYEILEIAPQASDDEVKRAYWRVSKRYHPDQFESDLEKKGLATDLFQRISAAYQRILASRKT